jgi:hypothetical protein
MDIKMDLSKFLENSKKIKKVKEDFKKCFNSEIYELEKNIKILYENEHNFILKELFLLDLNSISVPQVGRLGTILNYLNQECLDNYRQHIKNNYSLKELPKSPEKPQNVDKKTIEEFNTKIKKWKEECKIISDYNSKYNNILEWLDTNIILDLYGDDTLDITNLPYIYFKFLNTDIDEIEVFIQELKMCPVEPVKNIKRVTIEDISHKLPSFLKSANEVRVYFLNIEHAVQLNESKLYVEGVYEKYIIKNDTMKKDGGEWGMFNERKENLSQPVINNFSLNNLPTPINLNSGDDELDESDFYASDYTVDISDCLYSEKEVDGKVLFAIVPKDYWYEYNTILVNNKMTICGISDDKKWYKKDIYYTTYDENYDYAKEYLSNNSEYSEELQNYIENGVKNLIDFWTNSDDSYLKRLLKDNSKNYDLPSYNEVIEFLKTTPCCGDMEDVMMDDLIIRFIDESFELELT